MNNTKQILNKKFKKEVKIYYGRYLKQINFLLKDPEISRPDPQHC